MPEKSQHPKRAAKVFDLSWESDDEPDEIVRTDEANDPSDDDVESHGASGFNRPSES
jgi:hypothetical protein